MKKIFVKCMALACLLTPIAPAFANTQQQQIDLLQQQNTLLQQQLNALKQNQTTVQTVPVQGQVYYQPAPMYTQATVYPTPVYVQYVHPTYTPGPWYGGLAAGYVLGSFSRSCWRHGCHHYW